MIQILMRKRKNRTSIDLCCQSCYMMTVIETSSHAMAVHAIRMIAVAKTATSAAVPYTGRQPAQVIRDRVWANRGRGPGRGQVTRANTIRRGLGLGSLFLG